MGWNGEGGYRAEEWRSSVNAASLATGGSRGPRKISNSHDTHTRKVRPPFCQLLRCRVVFTVVILSLASVCLGPVI